MTHRRTDFESFAAGALPRLQILAIALVGQSAADDLVQSTMERLYIAWPKINPDDPVRYARRALVHRMISDARRPWRRREQSVAMLPESSHSNPPRRDTSMVDDRLQLIAALAQLPPKQRQAVVLRYLEDLSVDEVAALLGRSPGTIKRASHDGLQNLKKILSSRKGEEVAPR